LSLLRPFIPLFVPLRDPLARELDDGRELLEPLRSLRLEEPELPPRLPLLDEPPRLLLSFSGMILCF
jgi:hypothetical protein